MGKYLDIARKLKKQKADSSASHVENFDPVILEPVEGAESLDFIDHLTETVGAKCTGSDPPERNRMLDQVRILTPSDVSIFR